MLPLYHVDYMLSREKAGSLRSGLPASVLSRGVMVPGTPSSPVQISLLSGIWSSVSYSKTSECPLIVCIPSPPGTDPGIISRSFLFLLIRQLCQSTKIQGESRKE